MPKVSIGFVLLSITLAVYLLSLASWITTIKVGEKSVLLVVTELSQEAAFGAREELVSIVKHSGKIVRFNARMFRHGIYRSPLDLDDVGDYNRTLRAVAGFRSQVNAPGDSIVSQNVFIDRRGRKFGVLRDSSSSEYSGEWRTEYVPPGSTTPTSMESLTLLRYDTYGVGHPSEGEIVPTTPPVTTSNYNGTSDHRFRLLLDQKDGQLADPPHVQKWGSMMVQKGRDNLPRLYASMSRVAYGGTKQDVTQNDPAALLGVVSISVPLSHISNILAKVSGGSEDVLIFVVDALNHPDGLLLGASTMAGNRGMSIDTAMSTAHPLVTCVDPTIPPIHCTDGNLHMRTPFNAVDERIRSFSETVAGKLGGSGSISSSHVWATLPYSSELDSGDGYHLVLSTVDSHGLCLKIVIAIDERPAIDEARSLNNLMISLQVLSGVFQIAICFIFAQRVRKPLHRLIANIVYLQRLEVAKIEELDAKEAAEDSTGCCGSGGNDGNKKLASPSSSPRERGNASPKEINNISLGTLSISHQSSSGPNANSGDPKSWFLEIASLQEGHEALKATLKKVTSYVPHSLLAELRGDEDDDDDDDDDDEEVDDEFPEDNANEAVFTPMGGGGGEYPFHSGGGGGGEFAIPAPSVGDSMEGSTNVSRTSSFRHRQRSQRDTSSEGSISSDPSTEHTEHTTNSHHRRSKATPSKERHSFASSTNVATSTHMSSLLQASALTASSAATAIGGGTIQRCRVSIVYINFSGFHRVVFHQTGTEFTTMIGAMASKIVQTAGSHRGVLDFFQGDHFVLSFNAVKNCAQHVRNSIITAVEIRQGCAVALSQLQMKIGCSTSPALVGNIGCSEARRFGIIGNCYAKAKALSSMCNLYSKVPILAPRAMLEECGSSVIGELVDVVAVPQIARLVVSCPRLYVSLVNSSNDSKRSLETSAQDEWVYDLRSGEGKARYQRHNQLFLNFISGGEDCMGHSQFREHGGDPASAVNPPGILATEGPALNTVVQAAVTDTVTSGVSGSNNPRAPSPTGKKFPCPFCLPYQPPSSQQQYQPPAGHNFLATAVAVHQNSKNSAHEEGMGQPPTNTSVPSSSSSRVGTNGTSDPLRTFANSILQDVCRQKQRTPEQILSELIALGVDGTTYVNPLTQKLPRDAAMMQPQIVTSAASFTRKSAATGI